MSFLEKTYLIDLKWSHELDCFKQYIPPPKEIKTGSQVAIIGLNKPFTPKELKTNDIT